MRKTRVAAIVAAVLTLVFLIWLSAEVLDGGTARNDESVRELVHRHASAGLTAVMRAFTFIGSPPILWPAVSVALLVLLRAGLSRDASIFGLCMLGALAWEVGLKLSFHRARPEPFFGLAAPESYSYPSGHALFATCFYGCLAWLWSNHMTRRTGRILVWSAGVAVAFLIGFSRVYLGVHYPSDVVAGFGVGFVWTSAVIACFDSRRLPQ